MYFGAHFYWFVGKVYISIAWNSKATVLTYEPRWAISDMINCIASPVRATRYEVEIILICGSPTPRFWLLPFRFISILFNTIPVFRFISDRQLVINGDLWEPLKTPTPRTDCLHPSDARHAPAPKCPEV